MTKPATNQAVLEQKVLDYLNENNRTTVLTISADLDVNPFHIIETLSRLEARGKVRHIRYPFPRVKPGLHTS